MFFDVFWCGSSVFVLILAVILAVLVDFGGFLAVLAILGGFCGLGLVFLQVLAACDLPSLVGLDCRLVWNCICMRFLFVCLCFGFDGVLICVICWCCGFVFVVLWVDYCLWVGCLWWFCLILAVLFAWVLVVLWVVFGLCVFWCFGFGFVL